MKLNKITGRVFLFNLILSTITHSMALKCFTKAVFNKGQDETRLLDGKEWSDCADGETRCITVTGGVFNTDVASYIVKKVRKCASTDLCEGTINKSQFAGLLKTFDETIITDSVSAGSDGIDTNCCEGNYCNKLADEVAPTTAPSSGYKTLSSICFFVAMSILIWIF